ncbi:MAG: serine/threonine protein kinase [Thermoactinospora sp.]|nr:serine/threonine protein kinase [Thermoactinospora sp.]
MPESTPPSVGGRYRLAEELGRGGMGVVWSAHDEVLDRAVALKQVLLPDWVAAKEREQAFTRVLREARSAARLRHPGVITIHDVVMHEGSPWIVMELLPAESLHEVVDRWGPLTEDVAVEIGVKLLDALHAAHAVGITHRDVKPGNVLLLDDGGVVLTDFGVAHVADSPTITGTGMLLGSPAFMAPERLEGRPATAASDLWALGATLYTAVEGDPPYRGPTPVAVLASILMSEPRPMERADRLRGVIAGLMAKDPGERMDFSTARAALVRAGGHPEVTGSRALADLVRLADEADARGGLGASSSGWFRTPGASTGASSGAPLEASSGASSGATGASVASRGATGASEVRAHQVDAEPLTHQLGADLEHDELAPRDTAAWRAPLTGVGAALTLVGLAGYSLPRLLRQLSIDTTAFSPLLATAVMATGLTLVALCVRGDLLSGNRVAEWALRLLPLVALQAAVTDWLGAQPTAPTSSILLAAWSGAVAARAWTIARPPAAALGTGAVGFTLAAMAQANHLKPEVVAISWFLAALWMIWAARRTSAA